MRKNIFAILVVGLISMGVLAQTAQAAYIDSMGRVWSSKAEAVQYLKGGKLKIKPKPKPKVVVKKPVIKKPIIKKINSK